MNHDRFRFRQLNKCINCGFEAYSEMFWNGNDFEDHVTLTLCPACNSPDWEPAGELQQCTGIRDRNGKLIFEGDLILGEPVTLQTFFAGIELGLDPQEVEITPPQPKEAQDSRIQ